MMRFMVSLKHTRQPVRTPRKLHTKNAAKEHCVNRILKILPALSIVLSKPNTVNLLLHYHKQRQGTSVHHSTKREQEDVYQLNYSVTHRSSLAFTSKENIELMGVIA